MSTPTTWNGNFHCINLTDRVITNVAIEHICENSKVTILVPSLENRKTSPSKDFLTVRHEHDYWFVSFVDEAGNLWTGNTSADLHPDEAGMTVVINLLSTGFQAQGPKDVAVGVYTQLNPKK